MEKKKNKSLARRSAVEALGGVDFQDFSGGSKTLKVFDLKDNIRGVQGRIPQIGIIHPAQLFSVSEKKISKFIGVILHHSSTNAFWEKSFDESGGGTVPDCSSLDAIIPVGGNCQNKNCSTCAKNQFGTAEKGKGKACKNMWRLHIMIPGQLLPKRLTLPPSSLGAVQDFLVLLLDRKIPYAAALIEFKLKEAFNKQGIKYSEIVFNPLKVITDETQLRIIKNTKQKFAQAFGEVINLDEYQGQE